MGRLLAPPGIRAFLFDLDGVLTQTATIHMAAWKAMFDAVLDELATASGEPFREFTAADYAAHVDGRLRHDGVRAFLASRRITLPEGSPDDPPSAHTVHGLANRKNALVVDLIRRDGVQRYEGAVRFLEVVRQEGYPTAVVTASRNAGAVLAAAGLDALFDARIDGVVASRDGLAGKPAPDMFLAGASAVGVEPSGAAVFEDATAGVEAARAGGFGWVVGVDRGGSADALRTHGADVVVADLSELLAPA